MSKEHAENTVVSTEYLNRPVQQQLKPSSVNVGNLSLNTNLYGDDPLGSASGAEPLQLSNSRLQDDRCSNRQNTEALLHGQEDTKGG